MSKLLFCHYQPNGLGIKLLRLKPGVPSGELGRNQTPGNIGPNPTEKQDPDKQALEISRDKEADAREALLEATEYAMIVDDVVRSYLERLEKETAALDSSASSVLANTDILEFKTDGLETYLSKLAQSIKNDLRPAVRVLIIRRLIRGIHEIIQILKESPSKPILDDLQLLLMKLERYCPNEEDNRSDENAQLQNERLAQAVQVAIQDAKELVTTIKQQFPL